MSGTIIGAAFGLVFLITVKCLDLREPTLVYLSASVLIVPVIYSKRTASFFSCVVFLSIALTHSFDEDPYIFVFNRVIDTFIGILIGVAVNDFRLPIRYQDGETLYISGIDDVLVS